MSPAAKDTRPHVVIVGGGFGGLYAALSLGGKPVRVTLIDKRNFHLFQPLLYQVATGGLSAAEIASPLRAVLHRHKNVRVLMGEVRDLDPQSRTLKLDDDDTLTYDMLVIATGGTHHYFGHNEWADRAPGLKTLEDALEIRHRIFNAFEQAEREDNPELKKANLTFVIVGGGPTGVELAGALGELTRHTLKGEFSNIRPEQTKIVMLEGADRLLTMYPEDLSKEAEERLTSLGVTVRTKAMVTEIEGTTVRFKCNDQIESLASATVLWAAGVTASGLGKTLAERTGAELDRIGRVKVQPDFSIAGHPDIYVIGDLACYEQDGKPLPGLAAVAMQEGYFIADLLTHKVEGRPLPSFHYKDKGSLAVIGRSQAVADLGKVKLKGFIAWFIWAFVHIRYLVEFENKLLVFLQWMWSFVTRKQKARLITGKSAI